MPLVKIAVPAHLSETRIRVLANAIHAALVETCDVPMADRFQLISRFDETSRFIDPTFPGHTRSADASIIEVALRRGRSDDQKRALYCIAVERAVAGGWRADDIMIALSENSLVDWSFGGGVAHYAKA
jgi:4-oxalocrotonate tautomerase